MTIQTTCSNCKKSINASDKFAGRKTQCPACDHILKFPQTKTQAEIGGPPQKASKTKSPKNRQKLNSSVKKNKTTTYSKKSSSIKNKRTAVSSKTKSKKSSPKQLPLLSISITALSLVGIALTYKIIFSETDATSTPSSNEKVIAKTITDDTHKKSQNLMLNEPELSTKSQKNEDQIEIKGIDDLITPSAPVETELKKDMVQIPETLENKEQKTIESKTKASNNDIENVELTEDEKELERLLDLYVK